MDEKPARAWLWYFLGMWALIGIALIMLGTGTAHTQERPLCAPADILFKQYKAVVKEKIIWEGTMPVEQGVLEFVLFQNEKGNWTLFVVQEGIACLRAKGEAGTPNELGKGV